MYKKFFVILLSAVFIFYAVSVVFGLAPILEYGDLSGDGLINSIDASMLNRHILEKATLYDITAADLNGDKVINSTDYALLCRYILGYIDEFPVEVGPINGEITLGDTIAYSGDGISVDGSIVTITSGGTYKVSGTLKDGMIWVDSTEDVNLYLNNVDITNSNGPAIYFANAGKASIRLKKGSVNSLADGSDSIYDTEDVKVEGALVSNVPLLIHGRGTLNVTGNYSHGITSYSGLKITDAHINVLSSVTDGIHAKGNIEILDADIEIDAASDGIDCKGLIYIYGGEFFIKAGKHGVASNEEMQINDMSELVLFTGRDGINSAGNVIIQNTGLYIEANEEGFDVEEDLEIFSYRPDVIDIKSVGDAFDVLGEIEIYEGSYYITSAENDIFDADGGITIENGFFELNAVKHGFASALDITVSGAEINAVTQRDGFNADGNVVIKSGQIKIEAGEEGFDVGGSITVESGEIDITSFGDVFSVSGDINITKGNFNLKSTSGEDDGMDSGGSIRIIGGTFQIEAGKDAISADFDILIEDKNIYTEFNINAGSDALDAGERILIENGLYFISAGNDGIKGNDIEINGGEIHAESIAETLDVKNSLNIGFRGNVNLMSAESSAIYAREQANVVISGIVTAVGADNSEDEILGAGIWCESGNFIITDALFIAVGEINTPPDPELSNQCTVVLGEAEAGSVISIRSNTEKIRCFTAPKHYKNMLLSDPRLRLNEKYDVYVDGEYTLSFEINSMVTKINGTPK